MKTILLTGSEGLCGSYLRKYFTHKQYRVICIDKVGLTRKDYYRHDLRDPIPYSLFNNAIDYIIHTASIIEQKANSSEVLSNNVLALYNTLEFARTNKVRKILYTSSVAVLDNVLTTYGVSKILGEELLQLYNKKHQLSFIAFRLGYILGNPLHKWYFIKQFIDALKQNLPVYVTNRENIFSFIDVYDIASFCEKGLISSINGIYTLSGNPYSVGDVVKVLLVYFPHYRGEIRFIENENKHRFVYANTKTLRDYKLKFAYNLNDSIKHILNPKYA